MREMLALAAMGVAALAASGASAAPGAEIRNAVARVIVIPENRSDVVVDVVKTNPRLPLHITQWGDTVHVDGNVGMRIHGCRSWLGKPSAWVWGIGNIGYDDMPQLVIHAPMDVRVGGGGAIFGSVGRAASVNLGNSGCGDWTVADTPGLLHVGNSGSGDVRAGAAGSADLHGSGSGDMSVRRVENGLTSATSGSGDVQAGFVNGPLHIHIAGSGDFRGHGGQVTDMDVAIAGSGDVTFAGVAQSLNASVAGSGDVTVAQVTGPVSKHVAGSGDVRVGH
jgi:Putative auto-transporter adhesin, head GIN domain